MLRVLVSTKNDAFAGHGEEECARLLRLVAERVEDGQLDGKLFDINGNHCGGFDLRLEARQGEVSDAEVG
jgi:hypothetical protein